MFSVCHRRHPAMAFFVAVCASTLLLPCANAPAEIRITSFTVRPTQVYYLSDFDIAGNGSAADLFDLEVCSDETTQVRMTVAFRSDRYPETIVEAETQPFSLFGSLNCRHLTYRDFRGIGANPDILVERFTYNTDTIGDITEGILRTGKLPTGTYTLSVNVEEAGEPGDGVTEDRPLFVGSTTTLDLISPGTLAGGNDCENLFANLPQFRWDSDADHFIITVCELLPTNSGPEEVMQNEPRVRAELFRDQHFFGTPVFQYPAGGLPLVEGRTYYWQVQAVLNSPSGEVQLPSEIWCFSINGPGESQNETLQLQELLTLLETMGLGELSQLFQPGGPLFGFLPTGSAAVNGSRVDLAELIALLRNGSIKISSFEIN